MRHQSNLVDLIEIISKAEVDPDAPIPETMQVINCAGEIVTL